MDDVTREPVRVLVFSGAMRADSLNSKLARIAARELEVAGVRVDHATLRDFACPSYDGDIESESGIPEGAQELRRRLDAVDGFVISSPEYNASMPGALKNVVDWTSRHRPQPFHQQQCLLMSASPSMVGGNRGLWSLRVPLEHLGARVYPDMFSLAKAHEQFDDDGGLVSESLAERLRATTITWADQVEAAKHYPCAKARWFEFLGERPDTALDRVQ